MKRSSIISQSSSLLIIVLLTFLLSACGIGAAESDITVYKDKYQLDTVISVPADQMDMIGGPVAFEEALNEAVIEAKDEGLNLKWRDITERNSSTYRYKISTGKIDITDPYVDNFSWEETRFNNRKAYEFVYSSLGGLLDGFQSHTITLHAGRILDTNGVQLDSGTVTWRDPSVIPYAVVTPKGSINWLIISGIGIFLCGGLILTIGVVIAIVFLVLRKRKKQQ